MSIRPPLKLLRATNQLALIIGIALSGIEAFAQNNQTRYIAVLRDQVSESTPTVQSIRRSYPVAVGRVFNHGMRGFVFRANARAIQAIIRRSDIAYVVEDTQMHAIAQSIPTGITRSAVDLAISLDGQSNDLSSSDVRVAVLDTGLDTDHPDLNVVGGIRYYLQGFFKIVSDGNFDDDHWHGTHVGGTIGAIDNGSGVVGVAPGISLYAVKVLDQNGNGWTSAIIAGIDHLVALNNDADPDNDIQVANMSLGGGYNQALNDAVSNATQQGIVMVVAAGNEGDDASTHSPASEPDAITVSALADSDGLPGGLGTATGYGPDDTLATFSNFGALVDICAPGVDILSTYPGGQYAWASGTSMASPHVAGAAALYIANHPNPYGGLSGLAAVNHVRQALLNSAWKPGDPEYLLGGDNDGIAEPLLNVGPINALTYEEWIALNFPGETDETIIGLTADPDFDFIINKDEFGYCLDPLVSDSSGLSHEGLTLVAPGLPVAYAASIPGGVDFRVLFTTRKNYAAVGLNYTIQFSADLVNWYNSSDSPTTLDTNDPADLASVPYPFYIITETGIIKPKFFRVLVELNP